MANSLRFKIREATVALRETIIEKFNEALEQIDSDKEYLTIRDEQILLDTDLDSLGFAILVALLDEELGFDPFQLMQTPVYPTTFGEFVNIYENANG